MRTNLLYTLNSFFPAFFIAFITFMAFIAFIAFLGLITFTGRRPSSSDLRKQKNINGYNTHVF